MNTAPKNFGQFVYLLIELINIVIPFLFGLIVLFISWKIIDAWIINGGNPTKVKEGKQTAVTGVIVLVVLSGIWGILNILSQSLFNL